MKPSATTPNRSGDVIGGRYQLLRQIGAGGMGTVYEAIDTRGQRWALKLLKPFPGPKAHENARRFAREVRALEALRDPHVLTIVDADAEAAQPWLVTELLSGQDLEALLREAGRLAPATAVQIVAQIARGLATVHASGFLHRDVKPSNVFLHSPGDGSIVAKLLDFGVAKVLFADESLTETHQPLGTPLYMAPEQFLDAKRVDARGDVYSLGMTLYRMLSGVTPFSGSASIKELALRVTTEAPAPVQGHAPWVLPGLARAVHGAILRDRDARCPSMEALLGRLAHFAKPSLGGEDLRAAGAEAEGANALRADLPTRWSDVERDAMDGGASFSGEDFLRSLVGTTLGGRYCLRALIGAGGMGAVFEAECPDGSKVAVKVVTGGIANRPAIAQRFVREGRAAMKLTGAHVVQVLAVDVDQKTGTPFIVMELLRGMNLGETIRGLGPLPPEVAARIFAQVCEGLVEAHRVGIVHRDVKPTNLFLHRRNDGELVAKLCDFGLVKEESDDNDRIDLTQTDDVLGTPAYMSPEQLADAKSVDARTDVWSVGASLFEALTGQRLWGKGKTILELVTAISIQEPPLVRTLAPWVDAELADVVRRALQKEPADRIASARELADALVRLAGTVTQLDATVLVPLSLERRGQTGRSLDHPVAATPSRAKRRAAVIATGLIALAAISGAVILTREVPAPAALAPVASALVEHPSAQEIRPATSTVVASGEPASGASMTAAPSPVRSQVASSLPTKRAPQSVATTSAAKHTGGQAATALGAPLSALAATTTASAPDLPTADPSSKTAGPTEKF